MQIKEHNVSTGEIIERNMTEAEAKQYAIDEAKKAEQIAKIEADAKAKSDLLKRIGITADEARLLLS
jgi:hypothetical protein